MAEGPGSGTASCLVEVVVVAVVDNVYAHDQEHATRGGLRALTAFRVSCLVDVVAVVVVVVDNVYDHD